MPLPTAWTWGDVIDEGFNWQYPPNYVQFLQAINERVLVNFPYNFDIFPCLMFYDMNNFVAPPSPVDLTPTFWYVADDPTSVVDAINLQNTTISWGEYPAIQTPPIPNHNNFQASFNFKGIGELEQALYRCLEANYVDPTKVVPTAPSTLVGGYADPAMFLRQLLSYNNPITGYTEDDGIGPLIGQRKYPRRRKPREIAVSHAAVIVTGQTGVETPSGAMSGTYAPVGAIAQGIAVGGGLKTFYGWYRHAGTGTWNQIAQSEYPVAADVLDSENPPGDVNYTRPGLFQTGDYIDWAKFKEWYNLCVLLQYTAIQPELFVDAFQAELTGVFYGGNGWDHPASNSINRTIGFGNPSSVAVTAANAGWALTPAVLVGSGFFFETLDNWDDNGTGLTSIESTQWVLRIPAWQGLHHTTRFYLYCGNGTTVPTFAFDNQGTGLVNDSWNLWDTKTFSSGTSQTVGLENSKQWNPGQALPNNNLINPPTIYDQGIHISDQLAVIEWSFTLH